MKSNYKKDAAGLRKVLNELDFIGIYPKEGGPKDEYDCMIGPILSRLYARATEEEIKEYLKVELVQHFGFEISQLSLCDKAAKKIIRWRDKHT